MSGYYIYLISSLPMLQFGLRPPFSFQQFLQLCQGRIADEDIAILKSASSEGQSARQDLRNLTLAKWRSFDTALRNELVRIRSARRHIDPEKYLRQDGYTDPAIARIAINAYRSPNILESERMLDQARWQALDELALGHYFDIDFLIVYAHKLLILERWERIRAANSEQLLEEALR